MTIAVAQSHGDRQLRVLSRMRGFRVDDARLDEFIRMPLKKNVLVATLDLVVDSAVQRNENEERKVEVHDRRRNFEDF